jgi:hypothetical protein
MGDILKKVSPQTGRVRYEAPWRFTDEHGRPQRRGQTFRTKTEAERFLRAKHAELHLGTHVDPRRGWVLFWQVAEDWQASTRWHRLKPTSAVRPRLQTAMPPTGFGPVLVP